MRLSEIFGWDGALQKRFWSSIEKDGDCWNWKQHIYENGYGRIIVRHNGKKRQLGAHRIAYLLRFRMILKFAILAIIESASILSIYGLDRKPIICKTQ